MSSDVGARAPAQIAALDHASDGRPQPAGAFDDISKFEEQRMNTDERRHDGMKSAASTRRVGMKLEVAVLPVSDVDRAKRFYQNLGWRLDADFTRKDGSRAVQLTPPVRPPRSN
jgi:hypothetical protein